jgi:hypothetical protein
MKSLIRPGPLLRGALRADAALSAVMAAAMMLGAEPLGSLTGLPPALLLVAGLALLPWVAYLLWLSSRRETPAAAVWAVIVLNLLWAVDCALVAAGAGYRPSALGVGFALLNTLGALLFADLQFIGLKRAAPAPATA